MKGRETNPKVWESLNYTGTKKEQEAVKAVGGRWRRGGVGGRGWGDKKS